MSKALAGAGADVAMMYVSSDKTHDTAAAVAKEFGVVCKAYKADMSNVEQVTATLEQIFQDFGKVDVFVANAGICIEGPAEVSRGWKLGHSLAPND
jgi:NAD(P)-dependent dehydrogenase (short-subunit alcohol dehydrogenase family)